MRWVNHYQTAQNSIISKIIIIIIIKAIMRQHKQLFTKPRAFTDFLDSLLWIVVGALQAQIPPGFGNVNVNL